MARRGVPRGERVGARRQPPAADRTELAPLPAGGPAGAAATWSRGGHAGRFPAACPPDSAPLCQERSEVATIGSGHPARARRHCSLSRLSPQSRAGSRSVRDAARVSSPRPCLDRLARAEGGANRPSLRRAPGRARTGPGVMGSARWSSLLGTTRGVGDDHGRRGAVRPTKVGPTWATWQADGPSRKCRPALATTVANGWTLMWCGADARVGQ